MSAELTHRPTRFPVEVVDRVTAGLVGDKKALANASLLSQEWVLPARRHLFRSVVLSDRTRIPGETDRARAAAVARNRRGTSPVNEDQLHFQRVVRAFAKFIRGAPASITRNIHALAVTGGWGHNAFYTLDFAQLRQIVAGLDYLAELVVSSTVVRHCPRGRTPAAASERLRAHPTELVLKLSKISVAEDSCMASFLAHFPHASELHWGADPIEDLGLDVEHLGAFGRSLRVITQRQSAELQGIGHYKEPEYTGYGFLAKLVCAILAKQVDSPALTLDIDMVFPHGSTVAEPIELIGTASPKLDALTIRMWIGDELADIGECLQFAPMTCSSLPD